ncbi:MAG: carbohydrate ABC transporter permease [Clostridia bacterium]|nr:carbohydrate ABC transporter permease [Clostridia bacterium]
MQKNIQKKPQKMSVFMIVSFVVLFTYLLMIILPLIWAAIASFKTNLEVTYHPFDWPKKWRWANYQTVFENFVAPVASEYRNAEIFELLTNSLLYALGSAVLQMLSCMLTAYIVARFDFKFCKLLYSIVIVTMIIPIVGSLPSELRVARALGIYDTMIGSWMMKTYFIGLYFLIFHAAFKMVPNAYAEAAYLDGAGNFTVMTRVMIPFVKGTMFTVLLLNFITFWNDFQTPMVYMPSYPTIALGLYTVVNNQQKTDVPMQFGACMIVAIPLIILFGCFQDKLLGNITTGGLK